MPCSDECGTCEGIATKCLTCNTNHFLAHRSDIATQVNSVECVASCHQSKKYVVENINFCNCTQGCDNPPTTLKLSTEAAAVNKPTTLKLSTEAAAGNLPTTLKLSTEVAAGNTSTTLKLSTEVAVGNTSTIKIMTTSINDGQSSEKTTSK